MAYLTEIIAKKRIFDKKINEIKTLLKLEQTESLVEEFNALLEQRQSILLQIKTANNNSTINIGGNDVTIATAVVIRDVIKEKIDIITVLINNKECMLDKIKLQHQRDEYYNSYILLSMGISRNDLQVKV